MRLFSLMFLSLMLLNGCDSQLTPLTIVHTNDVHAHLLPSDAKLQDCDADNAVCFGGYARIKSVIDGVRQTSDNVVVLDAGDRFSGTVFYTLRKSQDVTLLTEQIGYDVLTLGNHEFDDGLGELFKFVQGISAPIVSANISFPTHTQLNERIVPSVVLNKNGLKIGVIGALSEETKLETSKAKEIDINEVIPAVRREAEKLTHQGVKVLIALTHIGIEADKNLARAVPELDIIVGGHTHTLLSNNHEEDAAYGPYPIVISGTKNTKTLIVTSGIGGHYLGILNTVFDKKGCIVSYTGDTIRLDETVVPNATMEESVAAVQQSIDTIINEPILHINQDIYLTNNGKYCSESCYVGEFLTDMLKEVAPDADIILLNAGGIRAALPKGQIAFKHIASAYPFDSVGVLVQMTGAELKSYLEHGLKKYLSNDRTNAFLQIGGGTYQFSSDTKTVTNVKVKGIPVQDDKIYAVLIPSFMAGGGDGFPEKEAIKTYDLTIRDMIISAMKQPGVIVKSFENRVKK
ncbi:MAG: bifunctional metallophosphatase/5'-nucleotidase [Alphaproteobacteria bacterium]|nr:bifunctional metallophosphatase/5'-nucleotidase [Alphaproteobacteria bacterium]